jgi:hypothetical protein
MIDFSRRGFLALLGAVGLVTVSKPALVAAAPQVFEKEPPLQLEAEEFVTREVSEATVMTVSKAIAALPEPEAFLAHAYLISPEGIQIPIGIWHDFHMQTTIEPIEMQFGGRMVRHAGRRNHSVDISLIVNKDQLQHLDHWMGVYHDAHKWSDIGEWNMLVEADVDDNRLGGHKRATIVRVIPGNISIGLNLDDDQLVTARIQMEVDRVQIGPQPDEPVKQLMDPVVIRDGKVEGLSAEEYRKQQKFEKHVSYIEDVPRSPFLREENN